MKHRASWSILSPSHAVKIETDGNEYVYAHPAFWARKGVKVGVCLGRNMADTSSLAREMESVFFEAGGMALGLFGRRSDVMADEMDKLGRVAVKKRVAVDNGVLSLFG